MSTELALIAAFVLLLICTLIAIRLRLNAIGFPRVFLTTYAMVATFCAWVGWLIAAGFFLNQ